MGRSKKNFIIPLVVYPFDVMVSIGESNEEITSRLEALNISLKILSLLFLMTKPFKAEPLCFRQIRP